MDTGSGRACLGVCDRGVGGERLPDGQRVRAYSQHSCISEVRAGPPSDSPRAAMRGPRPPSSVRRWRSFSRPAATPAAASARCHTGAGIRSRRRARRRPGRAAWAAATSQRRTGAPAPTSAITPRLSINMIDKQGNRRLQPEEILEGRGPPGHTDPAARTPSRVRQMARLMSITGRPPNGARRFASSKGIVRSLKGANAPITTPVLRPGAATAVKRGPIRQYRERWGMG